MPEKSVNHKVFDDSVMVLDRVLRKGKGQADDEAPAKAEVWAYCYLSTTLEPEMMKALKIERVAKARWLAHKNKVPLATDPFDFGSIFKIKIQSHSSRKVLVNCDGAALISAFKKGAEIGLSILVKVKDWDSFGELVNAEEENVRVTIIPGPKQEDLPLGDDEDNGEE